MDSASQSMAAAIDLLDELLNHLSGTHHPSPSARRRLAEASVSQVMSLARLSALNADAVYGSLAALEPDVDSVDSGRSAGEGHDKWPLGLVVCHIRT